VFAVCQSVLHIHRCDVMGPAPILKGYDYCGEASLGLYPDKGKKKKEQEDKGEGLGGTAAGVLPF